MDSSSVNCTSLTEAWMVRVRSITVSTWTEGGIAACSRGSSSRMRGNGVDDVGAGLLEDQQLDAPFAVLPAGQLRVFRSVDGTADILIRTGAPLR